MKRLLLFLFFSFLWASNISCSTETRTASINLAEAGSKTALSISDYYQSLYDMLDKQSDFENLYREINHIPSLSESDKSLLEDQKKALKRRVQLSKDLSAFYLSLSKLASFESKEELGTSINNLSTSIDLIINDTPKIGKVDAAAILSPVATSITTWRQSKKLKKAVSASTNTLIGIDALIDAELPVYNIMIKRYFILLKGNKPAQGIAEYLLDHHSMTVNAFTEDIPELKSLSWAPEGVKDPIIKSTLKKKTSNYINQLEIKAESSGKNVSNSLKALKEEHKKLVDGAPLTLEKVLKEQEEIKDFIDLLKKFNK